MNRFQISILGLLLALIAGISFRPANNAVLPSAPQLFTVHMACSGTGTCSVVPDQKLSSLRESASLYKTSLPLLRWMA